MDAAAAGSGTTTSRRIDALSEDARILLRMIGRRPGLNGSFRTADVLQLHPYHPEIVLEGGGAGPGHSPPGSACSPMSEAQVRDALDELSGRHGWLGTFRPGAYVFRALNPEIPEDACNPDRRGGRIAIGGDPHALVATVHP
jgi:hypothetical protein